jgi:hypothetical protein
VAGFDRPLTVQPIYHWDHLVDRIRLFVQSVSHLVQVRRHRRYLLGFVLVAVAQVLELAH